MKLTEEEFQKICREALEEFREMEPNVMKKSSGHMRNNATKLEFDGFTAKLWIDPGEAPYSVYTVINWGETSPVIINAPKRPELKGKSSFLWRHGNTPEREPKKNPNEGWIDGAVRAIAESIAAKLKGRLEINE